MNDKERDSFLDELLEASLARYRSAEPRLGFEQRLLANLRASAQAAPRFRWGWLALGAAAAALAMMVVGFYLARRPKPSPPAVSVVAPGPEPARVVSPIVGVKPPGALTGQRRPAPGQVRRTPPTFEVATPRRDQFPSPAPLSAEEKLLLRFLKEAPEPVLMALRAENEPKGDLQIRDLNIPPLEVKQLPSPANDRK